MKNNIVLFLLPVDKDESFTILSSWVDKLSSYAIDEPSDLRRIIVWPSFTKMAAVLDEVGKSAEKLVDEEKNEIVDEEDETGAVEASKKKKKKKKKKKAGAFKYNSLV